MSPRARGANPLRTGEPIRLTHCIGTLRIGGAEKQLAELICRLPKGQYRQSIVLIQGGGPLVKKVRAAGCEVVELGFKMKHGKFDPRGWIAMFSALNKFRAHLRQFNPHILHGQLYWANILSVLAGNLSRVPVVLTSRLQLSDYKQGRPLLQQIENFSNRFTTAVFANSEAVKRDSLAHERIDEKKLKVIHNGVVVEDYEMIDPTREREELGVKSDQIIVIAVANLHPYKGHADLINAVFELAHRFKNLRVLLPGRDQGAERELTDLIDKLALGERIKLLGERHDVTELLALSDIVVHPSHQEGFSNSILEGMMAGKPLIVTNVGGNPEAVKDGVNGFVVPPRDPKALAVALKKLIQNPQLRHDMGRASRERIQNEFSMFKMVKRFEQWYEELVDEAFKA